MILKVFAVRDMKAEAFLQPFFSPSIGSAVRAFSDAVNDEKCPFSKHPGDYVLYEIGDYLDSTAEMCPLKVIKLLGVASDFVVRDMPAGGPGLKMGEMDDLLKEIKDGKKSS